MKFTDGKREITVSGEAAVARFERDPRYSRVKEEKSSSSSSSGSDDGAGNNPFPEGDPEKSWSHEALNAWAAAQDPAIEFGKDDNKDVKLEKIAEAKKAADDLI